MNRNILKKYDPFPIVFGEKRTVGDFVFYFDYRNNSSSWLQYSFAVFCKKNKQTVFLPINKPNNLKIENDFERTSFFFQKRRALSIEKILRFITVGMRYMEKELTRKSTNHITSVIIQPWEIRFVPKSTTKIYKCDQFIKDLELALKQDRKEWVADKKKNNVEECAVDFRDIIKTQELIKISPLLRSLHDELNVIINQDGQLKKENVDSLRSAFEKIRCYPQFWRTLKKCCED